jgi:nitrate/TMAO reductase-like tetraheme cytochrome c subunit
MPLQDSQYCQKCHQLLFDHMRAAQAQEVALDNPQDHYLLLFAGVELRQPF